jgi:hypothetical protein
MELSTTIYATLAWGFDPETWGVIGFSLESVRNSLADELRKSDGLVLTMGTMGAETAESERGRILGLNRLSTRPVRTEEMVEPAKWAAHLRDNGGQPKWPFGLPIRSAEGFVDPPQRARILPRLHEDNLHRKLASNFEKLTEEEVAIVLACKRYTVAEIWSTPGATFISNILSRPPKGPPPSLGQRTLTSTSGPAATYCFKLVGRALRPITIDIAPLYSGLEIYKVGFSNNPVRRLAELNAYLPDPDKLTWAPAWEQWHTDEINAYAMEQAVFEILLATRAKHVKGEIFAVREGVLRDAFTLAQHTTTRPAEPIVVTVGNEEQIADDLGK